MFIYDAEKRDRKARGLTRFLNKSGSERLYERFVGFGASITALHNDSYTALNKREVIFGQNEGK